MNRITKTGRPQRASSLGRSVALSALLPLLLALAVWLSWTADNTVLRQQAEIATSGLTSASARIRAVSDWVYHHRGFAKNHRFFTLPALGPTPIDVLAAGGDCADKSRLVSAMLRQLGIDSGLVMIAPCFGCTPIHTVVEAEYENGRMVVDPVWDVDYPAADGRFLGVRDLAGTKLGPERVAELQRRSPESAKVRRMPTTEAIYDYAFAFNWDKNAASRYVASALKRLGYDPESWLRPPLLEDPKLALVSALLALAAALLAMGTAIAFVLPSLNERLPRSRPRQWRGAEPPPV